MIKAEKVNELMKSIRGGRIVTMSMDEQNFNIDISVESANNAEPEIFHLISKNCKDIKFQPVPNQDIVLANLKEILKLELYIEGGNAGPPGKMKIYCKHSNNHGNGTLSFLSSGLLLLNSEFDQIEVA